MLILLNAIIRQLGLFLLCAYLLVSWNTVGKSVERKNIKQTNPITPSAVSITCDEYNVCLCICIPCICVKSMCLPSICMSVQTVEVCVHVEMQLQLINGLNKVNTRFTILASSYFIDATFKSIEKVRKAKIDLSKVGCSSNWKKHILKR